MNVEERRQPWAPILVGTAFAVVMMAGHSKVGSWLRGFLAAPRTRPPRDALPRRIEGGWSLPALRESILGRRKASVVTLYGTPPTAVAGDGQIAIGHRGAFWSANTWYYPVNPRTQTAMAVKFVDGVAREVEFFDAPRSGES